MPKYNTPIDYTIYEKEVSALYNAGTTLQQRLLVSLCWITGARTSELIDIKKEDILFNDDFVIITIRTLKLGDRETGKFKIRQRGLRFTRPKNPKNIYLETIIKFSERLEERDTLLKYKQRWCIKTLHKLGQKAIGKDISVYHFRHSICTQLAMNGASIPEIMYFKGAISLNGVTPYIHAKPMIFKLEQFNRDKGLTLGEQNGGNLFKMDEETFKEVAQNYRK
jgi:site-specific recombinase XerD